MQVKANVEGGARGRLNHNEAQVRAPARGLKVRTNVKAGLGNFRPPPPPPPPGPGD